MLKTCRTIFVIFCISLIYYTSFSFASTPYSHRNTSIQIVNDNTDSNTASDISCVSEISGSTYHNPIEKYKLSNGLTVILEEDDTVELVNLQLWIRVGSVYEEKFLGSGITHLIEHMIFKGSSSKPAKELAKNLQALGGELDGATSFEYTHYGITVPKNNLIEAMELIYHAITKPEFDKQELIKEKEVIIHEMAGIEDNPWKYLSRLFFNTAYQGHPCGEPVIGRKPIFENVTKEDVLEYYKLRYIPQNIVLVITGNFDEKELKPTIERIWGKGIPPTFFELSIIPESPAVQGPMEKLVFKSIESPYLILGFNGPNVTSQDMYPMDIIAEIMGGGKHSRLVKELRDNLALVSTIDAWSYTPSFTGIWGINANMVTYDWRVVQENILKELDRLKSIPVSEEELNKAKKRIIHSHISSLETIQGKGADLGTSEIYAYNPLFIDTYIDGINGVTPLNIQHVANKYFKQNRYTICVLLPEKEKEKNEIRVKEKDSGITEFKLNNGIRVLIKEDHKLPLVTVRLVFLGGLLEESSPGLSNFFSDYWLETNTDFVKEIESKGGAIATYSGYNSCGCSMEVLKQDLTESLNILKRFIIQYEIDKEKFELLKKFQLAQIKQEDDRPYSYIFKLAKGLFFGKEHPYKSSLLGTKDSVENFTGEDVLKFKNKCLASENMVLVISGDVNSTELVPVIENIFNDIPAKEFKAIKNIPEVPVKVNEHSEFKDTEDVIIVLAYPGVSIYNKERYALEILEQLFSGLSGRLFESIRGQKALSYSVGAMNFMGKEPGMFIFYISTDSSDVSDAMEILKGEIDKIKLESLTEEELQRIKNHLLTQIQQQIESNSGYSLEIALGELYGLGWNYYIDHIEGIKNVTTDDIKRVANKYFRDDWYSLVIVGPINETKKEGKNE